MDLKNRQHLFILSFDMRNFLFKIAFSVIFIGLLPFISFLVMWLTGELLSFKEVYSKLESNREALYSPAFHNSVRSFKMRGVWNVNPDILVLGNSRVLGIQSSFWDSKYSFFNAGLAISKLSHFEPFLKLIPEENNVKYLILGLDVYFFNEAYHKRSNYNDHTLELKTEPSAYSIVKAGWKNFYRGYFKRDWRLEELFSKEHLGIHAKSTNRGFRWDGSYDRQVALKGRLRPYFDEHLQRIKMSGERYEYGDEVSINALTQLEDLLKFCKMRNWKVVAFTPPYAPSIYSEILSKPNEYKYFFQVFERIKPIFTERGYEVFDFSDPATIGLSNDNFEDALHLIDNSELAILKEMARKDKVFKAMLAEGDF